MFLTRLGFGSRMVVTGDITQVDLPRDQQSGLIVVGDILGGVDGVQFVTLSAATTSCAIASSSASSRPTTSTRCARRRSSPRSARASSRCSTSRSSARFRRRSRRTRSRGSPPARWRPRRSRRVTSRSSSSTPPDRRAERGAPKPRRPDRRALVPDRRARTGRRPARARRRRDLPRAHRRSSRGCRPRRPPSARHGPRDRRRRDARAPVRAAGPVSTRAGFVALAGRPNVGKSTLTNALVGAKVAIVSDRPQTTRRAIRGVATGPDWQLVLVDLPGVQRPRDALTERMAASVERELTDADAACSCCNGEERIGAGRPLHRRAPGRDHGFRSRSPSTRSTACRGSARRRRCSMPRRSPPSVQRSSRSRRAPAAVSGRCSSTSSAQLPDGPFLYEPDQRSDLPSVLISPS